MRKTSVTIAIFTCAMLTTRTWASSACPPQKIADAAHEAITRPTRPVIRDPAPEEIRISASRLRTLEPGDEFEFRSLASGNARSGLTVEKIEDLGGNVVIITAKDAEGNTYRVDSRRADPNSIRSIAKTKKIEETPTVRARPAAQPQAQELPVPNLARDLSSDGIDFNTQYRTLYAGEQSKRAKVQGAEVRGLFESMLPEQLSATYEKIRKIPGEAAKTDAYFDSAAAQTRAAAEKLKWTETPVMGRSGAVNTMLHKIALYDLIERSGADFDAVSNSPIIQRGLLKMQQQTRPDENEMTIMRKYSAARSTEERYLILQSVFDAGIRTEN